VLLFFLFKESGRWRDHSDRGVGYGDDSPTSATEDPFAVAVDRIRQRPELLSLPFGIYRAKKYFPKQNGTAGNRREPRDQWGSPLYIESSFQGITVFSAGPDKRPETEPDNLFVLVHESTFWKACKVPSEDLTSPPVRQRIREAFEQTIGDEDGYQLEITEKGVNVIVEKE
jgi:hypothetical protein